MSDLKEMQMEIRSWLEANCPAEMRKPISGDKDLCWGGRNYKFQSPAQKQWLEACVAKGYTVPTWPKDKAIKPGESTEIKVKFNTAGKGGGRQSKDVTLFTNTAVGREILKLKGVVNRKANS